MFRKTFRAVATAALMAGTAVAAQAADYTIRATANSNENDEDYDGLVVFKN
ncbi:MAG: TRAP transporter substrate-binding protein DctP, partial [Shimia sp.]